MASIHNLYFVYKKLVFTYIYIYIIILCKFQDVLILLMFLRFSRVIVSPLTIMCFYLSLLVRETGIYTSIMTMPFLTIN